MAKAGFEKLGGKVEHFEHTIGKVDAFVGTSGGPVDAYGDEEKKEKDAINMDAAKAFSEKVLSTVDAMGTDMPKKSGKPGQFCSNSGDHFKEGSVTASGDDAGKGKSNQSSTRA